LRHLIVTLPPATPGPYTLAWTSVSAEDGHQQSSFFGLMAGGQPLDLSDPVAGPPTSGPGDLGVRLAVTPDEQGAHRWSVTISGVSPEGGAFVLSEPIALTGPWRVEVGVRRDMVPDDVRVPFTFSASDPRAAHQEGL
jgi:hypothetical protein